MYCSHELQSLTGEKLKGLNAPDLKSCQTRSTSLPFEVQHGGFSVDITVFVDSCGISFEDQEEHDIIFSHACECSILQH